MRRISGVQNARYWLQSKVGEVESILATGMVIPTDGVWSGRLSGEQRSLLPFVFRLLGRDRCYGEVAVGRSATVGYDEDGALPATKDGLYVLRPENGALGGWERHGQRREGHSHEKVPLSKRIIGGNRPGLPHLVLLVVRSRERDLRADPRRRPHRSLPLACRHRHDHRRGHHIVIEWVAVKRQEGCVT